MSNLIGQLILFKRKLREMLPAPIYGVINTFVLCFGFVPYVINKRRAKLTPFDYIKVSKIVPVYPRKFSQNFTYGHHGIVKTIDKNYNLSNCVIEHGVYLGDRALHYDMKAGIKKLYTYSKRREQFIRESEFEDAKTVEVISIGPYIQYAKGLLSEQEKAKIKAQYGRILVVFPSHSVHGSYAEYDKDLFLNKIKEVAKKYDSVFVCMHWLDIQDLKETGLDKQYLDLGYTIVCAGHIGDQSFIKRLRDIIELSDMTMSNVVGTHIGYSICLGKPHFLFRQEVKEIITDPKVVTFDVKTNLEQYKEAGKRNEEVIYNAFSSDQPSITEQQIKVVKEYWGEFSPLF